MAPRIADEFVEALFNTRLHRFDYQAIMPDNNTWALEQVQVYSNAGRAPLHIVPLPLREATLQLNMKALDESGANLVILSRSEVEAAYLAILGDCREHLLAADHLPEFLREALGRQDWEAHVFSQGFAEAIRGRHDLRDGVIAFLHERLAHGLDLAGPDGRAVLFLEFILGTIDGFYRPWIQLRSPLEAAETPDRLSPRALVKYISTAAVRLSMWDQLVLGVVGKLGIKFKFPVASDCSSHLRWRPPTGMLIERPIKASEGATESRYDREQIQVYIRPGEEGIVPSSPFVIEFRISQRASLRWLVAALFAILALVPPMVDWTEGLRLWPDRSLGALLSSFAIDRIAPTLASVDARDVFDASAISLPLAFALVSLGWEVPPVRTYVVSQIVLATLVVGLWLLGVPYTGIRLLAFFSALLACVYNVVEAVRVAWPMPKPREGQVGEVFA